MVKAFVLEIGGFPWVVEGLQNLFRGISKGRSDDSDTLPVVSSVGLDESDGTLRFTVADGQMQVDMIWNLLTEQIGECRNQQLPKPLPNPDDLFRPTLIGAWAEDRLVGGAFVMPDLEDSHIMPLPGTVMQQSSLP